MSGIDLLEWTATLVLLVGVVLTSLNRYPLNIYVSFLGNLLWAIVAIAWGKYSLLAVQVVITAIYIGGIVKSRRSVI